jgi:hypothetical protein
MRRARAGELEHRIDNAPAGELMPIGKDRVERFKLAGAFQAERQNELGTIERESQARASIREPRSNRRLVVAAGENARDELGDCSQDRPSIERQI